MLPRPLRALCAFASIALFLGAITGLVLSPRAVFLLPLFASAALAIPAMIGAKPAEDDLARIEEALRRFSSAALFCFTAATLALVQRLAPLAVALWLVSLVLTCFVGYYRGQRRLAIASR